MINCWISAKWKLESSRSSSYRLRLNLAKNWTRKVLISNLKFMKRFMIFLLLNHFEQLYFLIHWVSILNFISRMIHDWTANYVHFSYVLFYWILRIIRFGYIELLVQNSSMKYFTISARIFVHILYWILIQLAHTALLSFKFYRLNPRFLCTGKKF